MYSGRISSVFAFLTGAFPYDDPFAWVLLVLELMMWYYLIFIFPRSMEFKDKNGINSYWSVMFKKYRREQQQKNATTSEKKERVLDDLGGKKRIAVFGKKKSRD
jgi:hypothetical protein